MLYKKKRKLRLSGSAKCLPTHPTKTAYELVWSDKVGYVWLAISLDRFMLTPATG